MRAPVQFMAIALVGLLLASASLIAGPDAPPAEDEARGRSSWYEPNGYRLAPPGGRPVTNFYPLAGFRVVNPQCYAGLMGLEAEALIPVGGGARMYFSERFQLRPGRTGERYPHRHTWSITSDPVEMMGVVSTSEGSGLGTGRATLWVNMATGMFRLVTDTRPRSGNYVITTTGPGVSRMDFEDFFFAFADHHYSYVDLSQLEAARGIPAVDEALAGIRAILDNRPPNVFMGPLDWLYDDEGAWEGDLGFVDDNDAFRIAWGGKAEGVRSISLRIFCPSLLDQFEARWGHPD